MAPTRPDHLNMVQSAYVGIHSSFGVVHVPSSNLTFLQKIGSVNLTDASKRGLTGLWAMFRWVFTSREL